MSTEANIEASTIEGIEQNMGDVTAATVGPAEPDENLQHNLNAKTGQSLLVRLCFTAEEHYGLRVAECNAPGAPERWGPVHKVHAANSYHYKGQAADISGIEKSMRQFCTWVSKNYGTQITELIHNPGCSIKDGHPKDSSFWGNDTWNAHANHVHLVIKGGSDPDSHSYPPYPGPLSRGSKGLAVGTLQARLNQRGYAHIPVDNDFGPSTEDRVRKFQHFAHITPDGIVGPETHEKLWTLPISP